MTIRPFQREDIDAMFFLLCRSSPPQRQPVFGRLVSMLLDQDTAAMVADLAGEGPPQLVGVLLLRGEPWQARTRVLGLAVHPHVRGRGLGRRLMDWAIRFTQGYGWRRVAVALPPEDADTQLFLAELGFVRADPQDARDEPAGLLPDSGAPPETWFLTLAGDSAP